MRRIRALIPYSNEYDRDRLQKYLRKKTGRQIELGPIGYGGKLTLQTMDVDLTHIDRCNITCQHAFPGRHFKNVSEFLEWHVRLDLMGFLSAYGQCREEDDYVALYYEQEINRISYVRVCTKQIQDIQDRFAAGEGETESHDTYLLLHSNITENILMIGKVKSDAKPYRDISPDLWELEFFRDLILIS